MACANVASVMATSTWRPFPEDRASTSAARIPIRERARRRAVGDLVPEAGDSSRPDLVADAGVADVVDVVARAPGVRPVLAVARDRQDDAGIDCRHGVIAHAELRHHAGPEALDDHIGAPREPQERLLPPGLLEIEPHRPLVAVEQAEGIRHALSHPAHRSRVVAGFGIPDLDHVRAHVGEMQRRHRAGGRRVRSARGHRRGLARKLVNRPGKRPAEHQAFIA